VAAAQLSVGAPDTPVEPVAGDGLEGAPGTASAVLNVQVGDDVEPVELLATTRQ